MATATAYAPIDPNEVAAFHSMLGSPQPQAPAAKGNFLTHLFPTIGGIGGGALGGAAGGALAGTAVLPGVGTAVGGLLGALLGGAGGGAVGKVAENKVEGQNLTSGVGGQAVEQGLLSAGPLRLLKGVGAAGKAALGGSGTLLDALGQGGAVDAKLAAPGLLSNAANSLKSAAGDRSAAGFGNEVGKTVGGQVVTPAKADELQNFITNGSKQYGGINPGTPMSQARDAQAVNDNVVSALTNKLGDINRGVTPQDTAGIVAQARNAAADNPALANAKLGPLDTLATKVTGATDIKSLEDARKLADTLAYPKGNDLASNQVAQQAGHIRDAIDQFVTTVPQGASKEQADAINAYKAIKGDYGLSKQALDATSGASASAKGAKVPFTGITLPAQASNGIKNVANATIANAGKDIGAAAANPFGLKGVVSRVAPVGLLGALSKTAQSNTQSTNDTMQSNPNDANSNISSLSQTSGDLSSPTSSSPFDPSNLEANIQRIVANGGSMKDVTDYVGLANSVNSLQAAAAKANPATALTTNQKNEVVSQQKALESLNAYANQLKGAGGAEGPLMGALNGSVLGNYTNPAARGIDAQRIDVASAIAGSLNPRGTVSPVTARIISEALPSIHDTPKVAQTKITNLIAQIKSGAFSADTPVSGIISNGQVAQ